MSNHPSLKPVLKQYARISLKSIQFYNEKHEWILDQVVSSSYREFILKKELTTEGLNLFLFMCEEYCRLLRKKAKSLKKTEIHSEICSPPAKLDQIIDLVHYLELANFPRNEIGKLYYFEQKKPKKISELLNVNINTVKYHIKILKRTCFNL
ncbi:MAG: hypothetical protein AB8G05_11225 [Oligoflexales bacterium]